METNISALEMLPAESAQLRPCDGDGTCQITCWPLTCTHTCGDTKWG